MIQNIAVVSLFIRAPGWGTLESNVALSTLSILIFLKIHDIMTGDYYPGDQFDSPDVSLIELIVTLLHW